jgi:hypothetical protein
MPSTASLRLLMVLRSALQFTRLCNGILRRLGKHQVVSTARLMMLIASTAPLMDRSGLNSIVSGLERVVFCAKCMR